MDNSFLTFQGCGTASFCQEDLFKSSRVTRALNVSKQNPGSFIKMISFTKCCVYFVRVNPSTDELAWGVLTVSFSCPSCSTTSYQKPQEILWKKTTLPAEIPGCEPPAFNCPTGSSSVLEALGQQNHLSCFLGCWPPSCSLHSCCRCCSCCPRCCGCRRPAGR